MEVVKEIIAFLRDFNLISIVLRLVLAMLLSWWLVLEIDNILDGRFGI